LEEAPVTPDNSIAARNNKLWILFLVVLALVAFVAMQRSAGRAARMKTVAASSSAFGQLKNGDEAKVVLEVTRAEGGTVEGALLEMKSETEYKRTGLTVQAGFDDGTKFVMGKAADVHPGAIIHVTGTITADRTLRAQQIVLLTGYVKIV